MCFASKLLLFKKQNRIKYVLWQVLTKNMKPLCQIISINPIEHCFETPKMHVLNDALSKYDLKERHCIRLNQSIGKGIS